MEPGNHAPCLPGSPLLGWKPIAEARFPNNREIKRDFSSFRQKIPDFCPNSAIFASGTGNNREFSVCEPNRLKTEP
jgi:hypothetical protein